MIIILSKLLVLFRHLKVRFKKQINKIDNQGLVKLGILQIGDYSYGKINALFWDKETKLIIGKFVSIADGVTFILGGNHRSDWITTYPFPAFTRELNLAFDIKGHPTTKGDITIGHDVWIGQNATILSGVTIGNGAVIGAASVVTKDIPSYAICVGNPARIIGYRFEPEIISQLEKIAWWDLGETKTRNSIKILCSPPTFATLQKLTILKD